ncbi:hypothetical protein OAO87_01400 [bacterium]|nr:hypothetical protein [bacterium]
MAAGAWTLSDGWRKAAWRRACPQRWFAKRGPSCLEYVNLLDSVDIAIELFQHAALHGFAHGLANNEFLARKLVAWALAPIVQRLPAAREEALRLPERAHDALDNSEDAVDLARDELQRRLAVLHLPPQVLHALREALVPSRRVDTVEIQPAHP